MQRGTSIYLLNSETIQPQWTESRNVEWLDDHIYCLLPSIGAEEGFARLYPKMPELVHELSSHMFLGKVN